MKLSEIRESFEAGTGSANALNRQLIFSGIAMIWILQGGTGHANIASIPPIQLWALILLASSLLVDVAQALTHTGIWYFKYKSFKDTELSKLQDKTKGIDEDTVTVYEKESWSIPTWILWALKITLTIAAYLLIIIYVIGQL